ncbi:kinase-like protein [Fomitiporia mediterranea MF3/22]|uniref:kinase-like protein n=1 Tax=Fomitiporia mediterranea (strain MF3/22) TaxID=694068 RepID=UPI0004408CCA|nr:kinase-like protein [Fomitiporia mediterranea MF3/22]EJC99789.1 kinase-like protein [Fomitiporia mediterranea MF3/22]
MKYGTSNEKKMHERFEELEKIVENAEGIAIDNLLANSNDQRTAEIRVEVKRVTNRRANYLQGCEASFFARCRRWVGRSGNTYEAKQLYRDIDDALELVAWWREAHLDKLSRETVVWNDMRAMARKMVFLLDACSRRDYSDDTESQSFSACVAECQSISITIIYLIDQHPEKVDRVRRCVELFVPIIFVLSQWAQKEDQPGLLGEAHSVISYIGNAIVSLGSKILACEERETNTKYDISNQDLSISNEGREEILNSGLVHDVFELERSLRKIGSSIALRANETIARKRGEDILAFSIQDLKRLQLDQIDLDETSSDLLGNGASGTVKRFFSPSHSKEFAVKIFNKRNGAADEKQHWNRIIREAEVWKSIDATTCRNINKLVGFATIGKSPYPVLVMDVCNQNLHTYRSEKELNLREKLDLMHDIVTGLEFLHARSCAHGDLSPDNILIKSTPFPRRCIAVLADFGSADLMEDLGHNRISVSANIQGGHEYYCAPEFFDPKAAGSLQVSREAHC